MTITEKIKLDWNLFIRIVGKYNILGKVFMGPLLFIIVSFLCTLDILIKKRENW